MKKTPEKFRERIKKKIEVEFVPIKRNFDGEIIQKNIRVGEFWWYYEGMNVGNEISKDGKHMRVCLILKSNLGNGLLLVAPITTKYHRRSDQFYVKVENYMHFGLKECWILLNQVKLIDKKRIESITHGNYSPNKKLATYTLINYTNLLFDKKNRPRSFKTKDIGDTGSQKIESPQPLQIV